MMQAATGVMFLMSSLYGTSQANAQTVPLNVTTNTAPQISTSTDNRPLTDTKDIEAYLRKELVSRPILIEIARCESTFRQYGKDGRPLRGIENPLDVGVFQINEHYHADTAKKLGLDLATVEGNVAYGKYLYGKYGTSPWVHSSKCWAGGDLALLTYK